ncbi:unnamed protein product, partial [Polarella glacialis]
VFPINSLEQFLINYCSERLHQFFIESVFKRQQACCRDEGISCDVKFQDNGHILEAIDSQDVRMLGILPVLEEQSSLQTGSSETFTESCHRRFKTSVVLHQPIPGEKHGRRAARDPAVASGEQQRDCLSNLRFVPGTR